MLPVIDLPTFDVKLLSSSNSVKMHPMTIKQEKLLLMAKEDQSEESIVRTLIDVLQGCVVSPKDIKIEDLPLYDIEWLFLKLRKQSIGNKVDLSYSIGEETFEFSVELDKVTTKKSEEKVKNVCYVGETKIRLDLQHTPAKTFISPEFTEEEDPSKQLNIVMAASISCIINNDQIMDPEGEDKNEMLNWIETLPSSTLFEIQNYIAAVPSLYYKHTVTTADGTKHDIEMKTLTDFFML